MPGMATSPQVCVRVCTHTLAHVQYACTVTYTHHACKAQGLAHRGPQRMPTALHTIINQLLISSALT